MPDVTPLVEAKDSYIYVYDSVLRYLLPVLVLVLLWLSKQTGLLITQEAAANSYIVPYLQVVFPL